MNTGNEVKKQKTVGMVIDTIFIMVLCFGTLLTTMMMRGTVLVGAGDGGGVSFNLDIASFVATVLGLFLYLAFLISKSDAQLKIICAKNYKAKEEKFLPLGEKS